MAKARFIHRPLPPLAVALMLGILLADLAPGGEAAAWALVLGAGAALVGRLRRGRDSLFAPLLLFLALGYLSLQPWAEPRFSEPHVRHLAGGGPLRIEGVVDGRPLEFEDRRRFVLRVERVTGPEGEERPAGGLLRVSVFGREVPPIGHGDRVAVTGAIRRIRSFDNPHGFDAVRFFAHRGVWAGVSLPARRLEILRPGDAGGPQAAVERVRRLLAERIDRAVGVREAAILKALVVGDRSGIDPALREAFTRTGTGHLLAISGLHVGLVAAFAFHVFRLLLVRIPAVLHAAWGRKGAMLLAFFPVLFYALLAGFSPSTQRAFLIVTVFLGAVLSDREPDPLNALAAAALAILAVQPTSLFSISFQLSFAAVVGILGGLECWRAGQGGQPKPAVGRPVRLRRRIALFFGVTLLATWATAPLVLLHFNTVSLVSLPANAVAVPAVGWGAVILGLAAAALTPFGDPLPTLLFGAAGRLLEAVLAFLAWLSAMPFAALRTVTPSGVELVLFYALSAALLSAAGALRRLRCAEGEKQPLRRRLRRLSLLTALLLAGFAVDAAYWGWQRFGRSDLRVTVLDVGGGAATLVEFPGGATALIDGGGFPDPAAFDVGGRVVAPVLWGRKIATVDTLVLSHPDSDHLNGLVFIARHFRVGSIWTNGGESPLPAWAELKEIAAERGIPLLGPREIPRRLTVGGAVLEVLHPPAEPPAPGKAGPRGGDPNDRSLVVRVEAGGASILIPGDIRRAAERELVSRAGAGLKSTILVSPHHGSRGSNSDAFLDAVAPEAVLVSCAGSPARGSPHPEVVERFRTRGVPVWRTDRNGAITVELGNKGWTARPRRPETAGEEDSSDEEPE
ncbi:MAG: DNA internalization-related competence protein ComEC/Rec2 [Desulfobacterales bacterium]